MNSQEISVYNAVYSAPVGGPTCIFYSAVWNLQDCAKG